MRVRNDTTGQTSSALPGAIQAGIPVYFWPLRTIQ